MQRYVHNPSEVVAKQWNGPGDHERVVHNPFDPISHLAPENTATFMIYTKGGWMHVNKGDWIVTDKLGNSWPVKPECFERLYSAVPEPHTVEGELISVR